MSVTQGQTASPRSPLLSRVVRLAVVCCLVLSCAAAAHASKRYHVQTYNGADGLGSSVVFGVAQDATGRMLFATRRGLVRYDGVAWEDLEADPLDAEQGVGTVRTDALGGIWTTTLLPPIKVFCREPDGTIRALPVPGTNRPVQQVQILAVDRTAARERVAFSTVGREVLLWADGAWRIRALDESAGQINGLLFRGDTLLIATADGLLAWDGTGPPHRATVAGMRTGPVLALCEGVDGSPWIVGRDWIGRLRADGLEIVGEGLAHALISTSGGIAAAEGPAGGIYYGDYRFCYYYHPRRGLERMDVDSGLVGSGATDILTDREGIVWITTMRGVSKLISRRFTSYDLRNGLLRDEVSAVLDLGGGRMLLGHEGGLTLLDDEEVRRYPFAGGRGESRVMALTCGPDGVIWMAGSRAGVGTWTEDGVVEWRGAESGLVGGAYSVFFDAAGTLWVGADAGLFRDEDGRFRQVDPSAIRSLVRRVEGARDGSLLVCTGHDGLFRYRKGFIEQYRAVSGQSANSVYDVLELPDGRLLVATTVGLQVVRDGRLEPTRAPLPQVDRAVYALLVDGNDCLWIGTEAGVARWQDGRLIGYGGGDGLIGTEVNRDALKTDHRGVLWIGTDRGVSAFDPQYDLPARARPLVEVTGYDIGSGPERFVPDQRLGVGPLSLTVQFKGYSFVDEKGLLFSTRLEGLEDDWTPARQSQLRSVQYTNLMPGDYRFQVRAERTDGVVSETASGVVFHIVNPLWQRGEIQLLGLVLAVLFLWFGIVAIYGRNYAGRLKREVAHRTGQLVESELRLRSESERLAATLGSISEGVLALDADGVVMVANPACEAILGRDYRTVPGLRLEEVLPDAPAWSRDAVLEGAAWIQCGDGLHRWLEISSADLVGPEGRSDGSVLVFRDVTEQRRSEADRVRTQKLESLGMLAGGIAHDFNNLLTVILGNTSLVADLPVLDDVDREALDHVVRAGHRARMLTQQLLTFARGGAPHREAVAIDGLVHEAVSLTLSGTNVVGEVDLPSDLPLVHADPGQIGQVLSNLLINACQAMPRGGHVRVAAQAVAAADGVSRHVRLTVEDDGSGIPDALLDQICEPYFTTKAGGTGLGLAIAYSIAARHEGSLTCGNRPEGGARFVLELPAIVGPTAAPAPPPERQTVHEARILFLDDEPHIRELVRRLLERLGWTVGLAADGDAAVAEYKAARGRGEPYDAVVLDMTIPGGKGGLEAFRELREIDSGVIGVAVSGYSHDAVIADPERFGFAAALGKPFDPPALASVLDEALRSRTAP
jgi:signal transduction histidine kinase/CheY-like chemotaxis protein